MPPVRHNRAQTLTPPVNLPANQHLPCPPNDQLQPVLTLYFQLGMNDKDITSSVMDHFDPACYGLSVFTVRRRRKQWGLESTRQQKHTVQSIATLVDEVKKCFPNRGSETIRMALLMENKVRVPRPMWSLDQHDKFKRYGLFFHVGLDPYPGLIHWCKVWWMAKNPKLIARFYFDAAQAIGGIPLVTQSDPGTENVNVAYAQTALHHNMEPSLNGSIQHQWFRKHGNIKPEIHWSVFRRDWAVGFQALLDRGVDEGYYDIGDPLECLVFRFIFIPFIQREVDAWVHQRNWTKRRSDCKKVLPNGIPMIILQKPHKWKAADYKIAIPPDTFNEIEKKYAPPDDPVFDLVPHPFAVRANAVWTDMGSPEPQFHNAWEIYLHIRDALRSMAWDGAFQQSLSTVSQPEYHLEELPADLRPDDDELLVVDNSGDEGSVLIADLTDNEDDSEGHDIGLDF
ncbi:hypothetical protein BJY52DRAFT_1206604 [Lactarius psammicola]|nr:hypothetical protein BJY52DRAFT_1206604 [Lactarius psammicola]